VSKEPKLCLGWGFTGGTDPSQGKEGLDNAPPEIGCVEKGEKETSHWGEEERKNTGRKFIHSEKGLVNQGFTFCNSGKLGWGFPSKGNHLQTQGRGGNPNLGGFGGGGVFRENSTPHQTPTLQKGRFWGSQKVGRNSFNREIARSLGGC